MNLLLIGIALAIPLAQQPNQNPNPQAKQTPNAKVGENMPIHKLDGQWTVTYAELDGKTLEGKGFTQVMIKGNVVTCHHDGKEKTWRLEFGPHNMVRCTELIDGKSIASTATNPTKSANQPNQPNPTNQGADMAHHTHHGVYIASPEYLCLGLNTGEDRRSFNHEEHQGQVGAQGQAQPNAQPGNPGAKQAAGQPAAQPGIQTAGQAGAANHFGQHGPYGANFVIILHRGGSGAQTTSAK